MTISTLISPKLLHKHLAEDVLLTTPRKMIPASFVSKAKQEHSNRSIDALDNLYCFDDKHENVLCFQPDNGTVTGLSFAHVQGGI